MNANDWQERAALDAALDALIDRASALETAARAVVDAWGRGWAVGAAIVALEHTLARLDPPEPAEARGIGPVLRAEPDGDKYHG